MRANRAAVSSPENAVEPACQWMNGREPASTFRSTFHMAKCWKLPADVGNWLKQFPSQQKAGGPTPTPEPLIVDWRPSTWPNKVVPDALRIIV